MTPPMSDVLTPHRHWLTFHRHPDWHGHCPEVILGHPLRLSIRHSCHRWHFHLPFTHKHTETGR